MAEHAHAPGFVVGDPVRNAITETPADSMSELDERIDSRAVGPAALVFERLRKVPVVKRRPRRDARRQEAIDETVVEIEPCDVHGAAPCRKYPRPCDAESVRADAEGRHQCDVLGVSVVVVARHVGVAAVFDETWLLGIGVPDRCAPAIDIVGALDLEGRSGDAPAQSPRGTASVAGASGSPTQESGQRFH